MTTVGVIGQPWRGSVTSWGAVEPWDGSPVLDWWIAADDRWHVPSQEAAVRQRLVDGTPVVETTVRIPNGDAVQRVYVVADHGGLLVVEIENASALPIAVAFSRPDLVTSRPPASRPAPGIALPPGSIVVPVAHRTTVRVALPCRDLRRGGGLGALPSAAQVARGWVAQTERGVRFVVPDLAADVVRARSSLLLEGPPAQDDPVAFLLGIRELVRLGEPAARWVEPVAAAGEAVAMRVANRRRVADRAKQAGQHGSGEREATGDDDTALAGAAEVLERAGEPRAAADVEAVRRRLDATGPVPADDPPGAGILGGVGSLGGVGLLAWLERTVLGVSGELGEQVVDILPRFPARWLGRAVEVHDLPVAVVLAPGASVPGGSVPGGSVPGGTVPGCTVSFAVRWHGERPALLWDCSDPVRLTCSRLDPTWSSELPRGETLLGIPAMAHDAPAAEGPGS